MAGGTARERIAFILGQDEPGTPPMFRFARGYFLTDPGDRADRVVSGARSLKEALGHLAAHPASNGRPWGVINLVVHGNATGLMDTPVLPGGPATTTSSLAEAMGAGALPPLPPGRIDGDTEIRIQSCSLGRDPELLAALAEAFTGDGQPTVRASIYYTAFAEPLPGLFTRHLSQSWTVILDPGPPPDPQTLGTIFRKQHPGAPIDPVDALERVSPRFLGDPFTLEHPMNLTWSTVYGDPRQMPDFPGQARFESWLRSQLPFRTRLATLGIRFDQLRWTMTRTTGLFRGVERPVLRATGEGRSITFLRALREPGAEDWRNGQFYVSTR